MVTDKAIEQQLAEISKAKKSLAGLPKSSHLYKDRRKHLNRLKNELYSYYQLRYGKNGKA